MDKKDPLSQRRNSIPQAVYESLICGTQSRLTVQRKDMKSYAIQHFICRRVFIVCSALHRVRGIVCRKISVVALADVAFHKRMTNE